MNTHVIQIILVIVSLFPVGSFASSLLPEKFGQAPVLVRVEDPRIWSPENMYEYVNGEAELLKRYGVLELVHTVYEHGVDSFLSVDLLDMGSPLNAYGLYRLYAGCDGEEFAASGAVVLAGGWTFYAQRGRHFIRMDVEGSDSKRTVMDFLKALSENQPSPASLPGIIHRLKDLSGKACNVNYHPEDVDYDLKAGPGYTWKDSKGGIYYLRMLETADKANTFARTLRDRGVGSVLTRGNAVAWKKHPAGDVISYLETALDLIEK